MTRRIDDFFASPVKIGDNGKRYLLDKTSIRPIEATTLRQLVLEDGVTSTLEIGLALGASAVAIAEALEEKGCESRHVALDPFQTAFGNVGLLELTRLQLGQRVEFLAEGSETFLPEAEKLGRRFDLIFDDGSRTIGHKVTNTFFADRCLNPGGVLVFHDAFIPSTVASITYLIRERGYELIQLPPDSLLKRCLRMVKYCPIHGYWFAFRVIPFTCRSLAAVRKTAKSVALE